RGSLLRPAVSLLVVCWSVDANFAAGRDADLSVGDNFFAGLNAAFDHNLIALPLAQRHLSLIDSHVLLDDVNVIALRSQLRRSRRYQHRAANRIQHQTNIHKSPGPNPSI